MFELADKATAVIGAASGIGKAIASAFADQGAAVHCLDIDGEGASATAQQIREMGYQSSSESVDVRDSTSVEEALTNVAKRHGGLDVVVSTPGVNVRKPIVEYTDDDYCQVADVNFRGAFNTVRGAARVMSSNGHGSIVLTSSISAKSIEPGQTIYAGTKAAIEQMTRVSAAELGPYGIRVNAIAPGPVETELTAPIRKDPRWYQAYTSKIALGRWAQPHEIAAAAVFLAADEAAFVNGEVVTVHGGWTDLEPSRPQGGE